MEFDYDTITHEGSLVLHGLDYTSVVANETKTQPCFPGYIKPTVWFKYLHIIAQYTSEQEQKHRNVTHPICYHPVAMELAFTKVPATLFSPSTAQSAIQTRFGDAQNFMKNIFKFTCCQSFATYGNYIKRRFIVLHENNDGKLVASGESTDTLSPYYDNISQRILSDSVDCSAQADFDLIPANSYTSKFYTSPLQTFEILPMSLIINICINCGDEAIRLNKLLPFTESICNYDVERVACRFYCSGGKGNIVFVSMWNDHLDRNKLHFAIKAQGVLICKVQMQFFAKDCKSNI